MFASKIHTLSHWNLRVTQEFLLSSPDLQWGNQVVEKFLAQGHRIPNPRLISPWSHPPHYPCFSVFLFLDRAKSFFQFLINSVREMAHSESFRRTHSAKCFRAQSHKVGWGRGCWVFVDNYNGAEISEPTPKCVSIVRATAYVILFKDVLEDTEQKQPCASVVGFGVAPLYLLAGLGHIPSSVSGTLPRQGGQPGDSGTPEGLRLCFLLESHPVSFQT